MATPIPPTTKGPAGTSAYSSPEKSQRRDALVKLLSVGAATLLVLALIAVPLLTVSFRLLQTEVLSLTVALICLLFGGVLALREASLRAQAAAELRQTLDEVTHRMAESTAELTHANHFLNALLENLHEGIVACDESGVLTLFNNATRTFHGLPHGSVPADQWAEHFQLYNPDGATLMQPAEVPLFRALRGETVKDAEMVIAAGDAPVRTLLASGQAFRDEHGQVLGAVVSMHDITRRKEAEAALQKANDDLELRIAERTAELRETNDTLRAQVADRQQADDQLRESEARFNQMADCAPVMIWVTDATGFCTYLNKQWYDFTGTTVEGGLGYGWLDCTHPDDRACAEDAFLTANGDRAPFRVEYQLRRHDGEYRWSLDSATPRFSPDGEFLGYIGSVIDIEERKVLEDNLRQLAANLSEADHRKDEFLATLAHELRNPLAPIRNGLQVMRLAADDAATVEQTRAVMERQLAQMVRLVDDLLDLSRITRNKLDLRREPVELAAILGSAMETSRPIIGASGHNLEVSIPSTPIYLDADFTRLAQVFSNLLNNAAKYTDRGGRIWLTVALEVNFVTISVKDTGIGIPPEMLPRVFGMFTQVDQSLERSQGGLGIGLTLVRRLVELHGGSVQAASEGVGRGSEFIVNLPTIEKVTSPMLAVPAMEVPPAQGRRILVVDDNRDSATTLAKLFRLKKNEVQVAHDGLEAVTAAANFRPEVVLLDIGMPRMNGYEAAARIRTEAWGANMVLIALTGWGQDDDRRMSKEAGFDGHMVKPVDFTELQALINELAAARVV